MTQVCDCYGLTKKKIVEAIEKHGLTTADAVYQHFEATECGVCIDDIESLIKETMAKAKETAA